MKRIAIVGKGGVGKTASTALIAKALSEHHDYKILLIDADPTHPHLCNMVKLTPEKSLEEMRLEAVRNAHERDADAKKLADRIDFKVYDSMAESKRFCLFSIGQPEGPGCFCPSNTLLRKVLESITEDFDLILIDCEAGLEQLNRMVLKSIDIILIVTDISLRSVQTAKSIKDTARRFTHYKKLGVIINKAREGIQLIHEKLKELDLPIIGEVPEDPTLVQHDLEGIPLIELPDDAPSYLAVKDLIDTVLG